MAEPKKAKGTLTIYDVAKLAGVSIASVSRVLNGQGTPRAETRDRVMRAVRELSFVPDGAARALSNGLKEVVGVVFRRENGETYLAGKADGLIFHDRMLSAAGIARLADMVPVVTLAGTSTPASMNVRCNNEAGIRDLVRHLVIEHGYRSLGYVSGRADSPDNRTRQHAFETEAAALGAEIDTGQAWQGNYSAAGGANVVESLLAAGRKLPRAVLFDNDQTALGVIHALGQRG